MGTFGFVIHPLGLEDVYRKFKFAEYLPSGLVEAAMRYLPAQYISHITGIRSDYSEAEGWFVSCPLTSRQMMTLPEPLVTKKIIEACKMAERLGAGIVGLGAFTSVVGDAGITISKHLNCAVTTGNSYTIATALEGTRYAATLMGIDMREATAAVVGATGSIGAVCAEILAREVKKLNLVGRNKVKLEALAERLVKHSGLAPVITSDVAAGLKDAQVVITVTSAVDAVIRPEHLVPGAVVCDVARPRDVAKEVAKTRDDVLVIEGGVVEPPGNVNFNFDFGFPPGTSYACMAETMILALENRYENFTLGREITLQQVEEISRLAKKHGFKLAGLRSFDRPLSLDRIAEVRKKAASLTVRMRCPARLEFS
ncbi:MAG TPA: shikimate dehydrogenase [Firmicutes bacterium]|nr:shikimate dehydrogenase [Bacillota bacterium]